MPPSVSYAKLIEPLKRQNWRAIAIVCSAAFFLAVATSLVVGSLLMRRSVPQPGDLTATLPQDAPHVAIPKSRTLDDAAVDSILQRNIFNSKGQLGDDQAPVDENSDPSQAVKSNLPLKLTGTIYGGMPTNGIALIENTEKKSVNTFVVGDTITLSGKSPVVLEILRDRVILMNDKRREYLELISPEIQRSRRERKKGPSTGQPAAGGVAPLATEPPPENYKEEGFERTGTEMLMTQDFRDRLLKDDFTKVLQDAKASPNIVGGKIQGFELSRIRKGSIYEKAGFQNGDIVMEINGVSLSDAAKAITFLNGIRNEPEFEVRYQRNGAMQSRVLTVR